MPNQQKHAEKMHATLTSKDIKALAALLVCVLIFVALTLAQDFLRSALKNSAFYLFESFLFSSFWWIFAPLLFAQYAVANHPVAKRLYFQLAIIFIPIAIHLLAFPFLVWVISGLFYTHQFAFQQTLRYTLSEHMYQLLLLYSFPFLLWKLLRKKIKATEMTLQTDARAGVNNFAQTLQVADGNKKLTVLVAEALYITASPPYICIHVKGKKMLYNETLKSMLLKLNPEEFVRVHKSTIININMVAFYTSRLNGDYDVTMNDNATLRVSRNFAPHFKELVQKTHQLTAK